MFSIIFELKAYSGVPTKVAEYTLEPKRALIVFVQQSRGNFNAWSYPEHMDGIRESGVLYDRWYYDDLPNGRVLAAYPA